MEDAPVPDEQEDAYFEVTVEEPTRAERLALYVIYKEVGGDPLEPHESWLKEEQANAA